MHLSSETVLLYNFTDKELTRKVKSVLVQMKIKIKSADHSQLNETVGFLLGIKGVPSSKCEDDQMLSSFPEKELLVMKGFSNTLLNNFLHFMHKNGIQKIPYKAIITPTNQSWSLRQLYDEIEREHKEVSGIKE